MRQRYYFDLSDGDDLIEDDEGVEAQNLDQAMREAQVVIEEMRNDGELPSSSSRWHLVIRDESGATVGSIPLS